MQETAWEDVHIGQNGKNHGWPACEGPCDNPDYAQTCSCGVHDDPLFAYPHENQGAAIIGGGVYRGSQLPSTPYFGAYFYGDFTRRWLRYLTFDANGNVKADTQFSSFVGRIFHLGYSNAGAIFYTTDEGELHRISYDTSNRAPEITSLSASTGSGSTTLTGPVPLTINFAVGATDAEGDPITYRWLFGDGTEAATASASHTYTATGTYYASALASDAMRSTQSNIITIEVGLRPTVTILSPDDGATFRAGDFISLSGDGSDPFETLDDSAFSWTVRFRHDDHFHPVVQDLVGRQADFSVPFSGHDFSGNVAFDVTLKVSDSEGLTSSTSVELLPQKQNLVFNTLPTSISTTLDGIPQPPPFLHDSLRGFRHTIGVEDVVCAGDVRYAFHSWSDGGSAEHTITVPNADTLYLANYVESAVACQTLPVDTGLVARWQADYNVVTSAGSSVETWGDRSGTTTQFVRVVGTEAAPFRLPDTLNGRGIIRLGGSAAMSAVLSDDAFAPGSANRTVIMLVRYPSGTQQGGVAVGSGDSLAPCSGAYQLARRDGGLGLSTTCGGAADDGLVTDFASVVGYWLLYTLRVSAGMLGGGMVEYV